MHTILENKKLLVLGASSSEISLVKRAKELGVYVIVADNNTDWKKSPAKYFSDEAWDVSWSDIDKLSQLCSENNIDGVIAGYSEFRCENLIKLTSSLNLPCYLNEEQLEITRDKIRFKEECLKYDVPVIKEYKYNSDNIEFPVIVKPVDRGGSIGISIANNTEELEKSYKIALESSVTKEVIIEKFIENRPKVDIYYAIEDEKIYQISICDTIHATKNGKDKVVQTAWLYPTREYGKNFSIVDENIKKMIRGLGIKSGCITYSAFLLENGEYAFFESGFRLEGAHQYGYVLNSLGFNYLDIFIQYSILGKSDILSNFVEPINTKMKSVVINLYANKGKVEKISGFDKISEMDYCTFTKESMLEGTVTSDDRAILEKIGMFSFCNEDPSVLAESVENAYREFSIIGDNNEDLLYDKLDPDIIRNWWK